jgi:hypothetical protein
MGIYNCGGFNVLNINIGGNKKGTNKVKIFFKLRVNIK